MGCEYGLVSFLMYTNNIFIFKYNVVGTFTRDTLKVSFIGYFYKSKFQHFYRHLLEFRDFETLGFTGHSPSLTGDNTFVPWVFSRS